MNNTGDIKRVYFLGIGGIGMSALARYFQSQGAMVSGYDKTPSPLTDKLQSEGMDIHFDDNPSKIPADLDLVVITPAIPADLLELKHLSKTETPIMKRSEVLGFITTQHPSIAVAGTHGKTSVTALIAHLLNHGDVSTTAFIGGISRNFDSNCIISEKPEFVIAEADEFDRSFMRLSPDKIVITSIDADHLDIYGDKSTLVQTFSDFKNKIVNAENIFVEEKPATELNGDFRTYGLSKLADIRITNYRIQDGFQFFDYESGQTTIKALKFSLPGDYNLKNAAAAISVALQCGVSEQKIRSGLDIFLGVERRFDIRFRGKSNVYIDDYAHHPEELKACINAIRTLFPDKKITGVFQPHLFSRTADFADGFASSLDLLDEAVLLPIYPAREKPIEGVTSKLIFDKMKSTNKWLIEKSQLMDFIENKKPELLVTLGAGDIDRFTEPIRQYFEKSENSENKP